MGCVEKIYFLETFEHPDQGECNGSTTNGLTTDTASTQTDVDKEINPACVLNCFESFKYRLINIDIVLFTISSIQNCQNRALHKVFREGFAKTCYDPMGHPLLLEVNIGSL